MKTKLLFLTLLLSGFAANGMEAPLQERMPEVKILGVSTDGLRKVGVMTVPVALAMQYGLTKAYPDNALIPNYAAGTMLACGACCVGLATVGECLRGQEPRADVYRVDRRD